MLCFDCLFVASFNLFLGLAVETPTESRSSFVQVPLIYGVLVSSVSVTNLPSSGSSQITINGLGFLWGTSPVARFGTSSGMANMSTTSCAASNWVSDTHVTCKAASGSRLVTGQSVVFSSGGQYGSLTHSWSYNFPAYASNPLLPASALASSGLKSCLSLYRISVSLIPVQKSGACRPLMT